MTGRVRLRGRHSYLGVFFEYGTSPHFLQAGDSQLSARKLTQKVGREGMSEQAGQVLKIGADFVSGAVYHPGMPAHPFLRPALDTKAAEAIQAMGNSLADYLKAGELQAPRIEVGEEDE